MCTVYSIQFSYEHILQIKIFGCEIFIIYINIYIINYIILYFTNPISSK